MLAGFLVGGVTGLFPGLHVNVTAALIASLAPTILNLGLEPMDLVIFILAAAISHCYWELVPSLLLGVPSDPALALLPGHRLVREGRGGEALLSSLVGSSVGLLGAAFVLALLAWVGSDSLQFLENLRGWPLALILVLVSAILVLGDSHRWWALAVFGASGLFGLVVLNFPGLPSADSPFNALFPALTGMFGTSALVLALMGTQVEAARFEQNPATLDPALTRHASWGILGGIGVGLLPGLGAGNMAALFDLFQRSGRVASEETYLARVAAVNTSDALFGIAALYLLGRPRSGASVAIESILPEGGPRELVLLAGTAGMAGLLAHVSLRRLGFPVARSLASLHGRRLNLSLLVLMIALVLGWTGWWGLLVLAAATFLGMSAPLAGVRRTQAMGFLLVPTILFYSGLTAPVLTALRLEAVQLPPTAVDPSQVVLVMGIGVCMAVFAFWLGGKWGGLNR